MFNPGLQDQFREWSREMDRILDRTVREVQAGTW